MRTYIQKIISNPLFLGSMIMIIGSNFNNALNYVYHLLMGRLLGPSDYGELASLLTLMGLLSMVPFSMGLVVIKFINSSKNEEEGKALSNWIFKNVLIVSVVIFVGIVIISPLISNFMNIKNLYNVIFVGLIFLFYFPAYFNRSVLQSLLKFNYLVLSLTIENTTKLILGVLLVFLGMSVGGALGAIVMGSILGFFLSWIFMKNHSHLKLNTKPKLKPIFMYSLPVILHSLAATSLYSSDLVLVKHFFTAHEAGIYASVTTLGKIIYFGTGPISAVMFPIIVKKHAAKEGYIKVFIYSLCLTSLLGLFILLFYTLMPNLAIRMLYGSAYLEASNLLLGYGVFIFLYTLSTLFINYFLSIGRTKIVILPAIAALVQIIAILYVHTNLMSIVLICIIDSALLLLGLFVYFAYGTKANISNSPFLQAGKYNSRRFKKNKRGS